MGKREKKNILIIGHARHGKDTVAELFAKHGYSHMSSSEYAGRKYVYDAIKDIYGYQTFEECYNDRVNHRDEWFNLISDFAGESGDKVSSGILSVADIYVGMRSRREFEASKNMFDHVIWVDRSRILPSEKIGSNELTIDDSDIVIDNNGDMIKLKENVNYAVELIERKES